MRAVRARTPARIFAGRAGPGYLTQTQLELRQDHAAAVDAVHAELDIDRDFSPDFVQRWKLFAVSSCARSKTEFLLRPDLGRRLDQQTQELIARNCAMEPDLQVIIGDGLSARAVRMQVPPLLPLLADRAKELGWRFGQSFVVRNCRVGILNPVGALVRPRVAVLLIGERPGLNTAESLSAYMAYAPRIGHTDAERNLISNIHARGVSVVDAAHRIMSLAQKMMQVRASGVMVKEELNAAASLAISSRPSPEEPAR
jgi:ethanolamine ammonia-lyase small subunit